LSSTNRSNNRNYHVSDYYVTNVDKIVEFLKEFIRYESETFEGVILDCAAGGDLNHPMSYPEALKQMGYNDIRTIDIREDSLAELKTDYLTYKLDYKPKTIITNPPFGVAREMIEKALDDVEDNGWVIMLLRLNFLESKTRKVFFEKNIPEYIFVYSSRMSFTDNRKTDSVAYAHYCFRKNTNPNFAKIKII
jgi:hypothetical protein